MTGPTGDAQAARPRRRCAEDNRPTSKVQRPRVSASSRRSASPSNALARVPGAGPLDWMSRVLRPYPCISGLRH
jgi:hypothetical protein